MDADGPSPKRRKLSDPPSGRISQYVPLARTTIEVALHATQKASQMPLDENLAIKPVGRIHDGKAEIILHRSSTRSSWTFNVSRDLDSAARTILQDARSMAPLVKITDRAYLQACHNGVLRQTGDRLLLQIELLWCNTTSLWDKVDDALLDILRRHLSLSRETEPAEEEWQPREFYDNVHVPEKNKDEAEIDLPSFQTSLYPFQRRTLRWMLRKEGVELDKTGIISPVEANTDLPEGFVQIRGIDEQIYYVNAALGVVSSNFSEVLKAFATPRGGLLADEMGLGKTLAVVGSVCAHRRPITTKMNSVKPRVSGATLIITPPTLLEQWKDEISEHSADLRVVSYEGVKSRKGGFESLVDDLAQSDIVLTTYSVISREVHYVQGKPDRALRNKSRTETPKSPLTEISWWRVCLDEAQMVESGVSNAATVARLVPREIAWAVTGTPLRKAHRDLYGIMVFLRYQPWCWSPKLWDRLIEFHRPLFRALIKSIAIRHTKDFVREDLRLPPQTRHTITLPFTAVEEQHYDNLFDEMCNAVNLRADGSPRTDGWDPEDPKIVEEMRRWLSRLRQTCLHPEVGARNRRALGRGGGPLRTVGQVLDVMIDQVEGNLRTEQRALLMSQIRRGQMLENAKSTKDALALWRLAYEEATNIVAECRERLDAEIELVKQEQVKNEKTSDDSDEDQEDELDVNIQTLRQRLRSALEVQHVCIFFMGNAYYQLKSKEDQIKPDSEEFYSLEKQETEAYDEAKKVRAELLAEALNKANKLITSVRQKSSDKTPEALMDLEPHEEYTGIESRKICEKLHYFCEAINKQGKLFQDLRRKMIEFLKQALIDDDAGVELQGDEYEASTKHQDEMYVYMEALRILFADRSDAITGLENQLIRHEVRGFLRNAKEEEGPAPELMLKLLAERSQVYVNTEKVGSLRGIVAEARHLVTMLQVQETAGSHRARAELVVAEELFHHAQQLASSRSKALAHLEQEVNLFRDTMNSRLDYYRALQKLSDTVAPYEEERVGEPLDQVVFDSTLTGERAVSAKISTLSSKRRYLAHLKEESTSTAPRICTICQYEFEIGTLTVCGHQFCKECIQLWWNEHRNCPVCKRRLFLNEFHDITYKPADLTVRADETPSGSVSPTSNTDAPHNQSIYTDLSSKTLNEIKNMDLHGPSFGSKVDMLIRHILWLRDHDSGTKCIVFSQYHDFLNVLSRAFKAHNISVSAFDDRQGIQRFKTDPAIECFLLHAKAHSAGLNLVCASHVFLCEPLLATAVELQAIARVHRIGQHRATTVWMYIIAGTIEESIYDLSVARRLEHIKRNVKKVGKSKAGSSAASGTMTPRLGENVIDQANSLELQEADMKKLLTTGRQGGEHVDKADLWQCLFGHRRIKESVMGGHVAAKDAPPGSEVSRFLRAEAALRRADQSSASGAAGHD